MSRQEFIFSNRPRHRISRHIAFWLIFAIHFFTQNLIVGSVNEALNPRNPLESLINILHFLPVYIISVYIFLHLLTPNFLVSRNYGLIYISTAGLLLFNFIACYLSGVLYLHLELDMPYQQITFADNKYYAIVNGAFLSVMILGIAGGIKLSKKWFQKQRENEALAREKIASELQLLKIQINPRFLFHALNTLKQHIIANSPRSPQLILQIADLLSYILYESDQDYISLEKELSIVNDYLTLEGKGSDEELQIEIRTSGETSGKYITPLILLSIVETSLEYFIEKKNKISIEILVNLRDNELDFSIDLNTYNEDSPNQLELNEKLTGIRKQLHSAYQDNHKFTIESYQGKTNILLQKLPLHREMALHQELTPATRLSYENV